MGFWSNFHAQSTEEPVSFQPRQTQKSNLSCNKAYPLYGFFQWVLYRAHVLATNKLIALTGAVALVVPWALIAEGVGEFIIPFLIGLAGFGLSFSFARRFRLYA